jgi:peptidoglycan/LPS O-acetylase OafA/YrhL
MIRADRDLVLDFWRGVAILGVLFHHLFYFHLDIFRAFYAAGAGASFFSQLLWRLDGVFLAFCLRAGPMGVKIFFIVSGYIITKLMLEEERTTAFSLGAFYTRRLFRILPAYVVYLGVVAIAGVVGLIALEPGEPGVAAAFLCNSTLTCGWYTIHTWTLAIEMQFYLVWPLLFMLIPADRREHFLIATLATLGVLSASGVFLSHTWIDNPLSFACIALGALCAVSLRIRMYLQTYGLLLVVGVGLVVALLYFSPGTTEAARVLYRLATPAILAVFVFIPYMLPRFVASGPFRAVAALGLASYSLYLWQQLFLSPGGPQELPYLALQAAGLTAVTLASYFWIEKPMQRFARRLLHTRAKQEAPGL